MRRKEVYFQHSDCLAEGKTRLVRLFLSQVPRSIPIRGCRWSIQRKSQGSTLWNHRYLGFGIERRERERLRLRLITSIPFGRGSAQAVTASEHFSLCCNESKQHRYTAASVLGITSNAKILLQSAPKPLLPRPPGALPSSGWIS